MSTVSKNIATALFMVVGAMMAVLIWILLVPQRDLGLLDWKLALAIGASLGYLCFRFVVHFFDKGGDRTQDRPSANT